MSETKPPNAPWRNFYGRRKGKGLRPSQETYLSEDLTELSPGPVDWQSNPERNQLSLKTRFPDAQEIWLEIGKLYSYSFLAVWSDYNFLKRKMASRQTLNTITI